MRRPAGTTMDKTVNRLQWISELLLSLNVAWIAVAFELSRPTSLIYKFGGFPLWKRYWLKIGTGPYGVFDQLFWSLILALAIFLGLSLVTRIWSPGRYFHVISGLVVIAGFPALTLRFWTWALSYSVQLIDQRFQHFHAAAAMEIVVAIICATCYALRKWPLGTAPSLALLTVHFGYWIWLTQRWFNPLRTYDSFKNGGDQIVGNLFLLAAYFGLPIIAMLASLTWARYVRALQPRDYKGQC